MVHLLTLTRLLHRCVRHSHSDKCAVRYDDSEWQLHTATNARASHLCTLSVCRPGTNAATAICFCLELELELELVIRCVWRELEKRSAAHNDMQPERVMSTQSAPGIIQQKIHRLCSGGSGGRGNAAEWHFFFAARLLH